MIPRIQTGASFEGAGLYYLHDKKLEGESERLSTGRVAWTFALNTLENDPEAVLAEMAQTARDQGLLKMMAGKRGDGRPTGKTVMTVSLAWSPEQQPGREDMIEAGRSFLDHMGWKDHQVLLVAHNDTKHPHVHLIINRIHPETGMTIDDAWSKVRSQKWALAYEREHGRIYCEGREAKYGRDEARDPKHMTYRDWKVWQELSRDNAVDPGYKRALENGEWAVLKGAQRDSRMAYWKETVSQRRELRHALREQVRGEFAPAWQAYALEKEAIDAKTILYDREARRAMRHYRQLDGKQKRVIEIVKGADGRTYRKRRGIESAAIEQIKERQKAFHTAQREALWQMRAEIAAQQKERLDGLSDPALRKLSADRDGQYRDVLKQQRGERSDLRGDQSSGARRRDLLTQHGAERAATSLTPQQLEAYRAYALRITEANESDQRTERPASADDAPAAREATDRERRKSDKEKLAEGERREGVKWYLAKRAKDRARDRGDDDGGGGRER